MLQPRSRPLPDRLGQLVKRDRHPLAPRLLDRQLVVTRRTFCTNPCLQSRSWRLRSCLNPRASAGAAPSTGPDSHRHGCWRTRRFDARQLARAPQSTPRYTGAWSVTTSTGVILAVPMARRRTGEQPWHHAAGDEYANNLAELVDRAVDVAPLGRPSCRSRRPANDLPPGAGYGRAASASNGVNRCTHRGMVMCSMPTPCSVSSSSTSR